MKLRWLFTIIMFAFGSASPGEAQQPTKIPRVGYLSAPPLSASATRNEAFRQGMRELSYVEGRILLLSGDMQRETRSPRRAWQPS